MGLMGQQKPPIPDGASVQVVSEIMLTNILFFCQQKNLEKIIASGFQQTIYREYVDRPNTRPSLTGPAEIPMAKKKPAP